MKTLDVPLFLQTWFADEEELAHAKSGANLSLSLLSFLKEQAPAKSGALSRYYPQGSYQLVLSLRDLVEGFRSKDLKKIVHRQLLFTEHYSPESYWDDPERWIFSITEYFSLLNTPTDQRLRIMSFNLEGAATEWFQWMTRNGLITTWTRFEESVKNRFGPSKYEDQKGALSKLLQLETVKDYQREFEKLMNQAQHLEETTFYKSNKVKETEARVKATVHKENATTKKKETIKEITDTLTPLQSEVASLEAKRSLDANEEIKKDHTLVHELEKQVEKLPMELQLKNNIRGALETKDSLHDLQEVKTKRALKIDDEEFKKAKSEATRKIRKLAKVYDAWLPPWLASCLVVYQPYVKNHWKEFMFVQGRIWDPEIKIYFRHHLEDKVVLKEWGMICLGPSPRLIYLLGFYFVL
ncbi:myosin heavy chain-related protein [Tanacetum coccineum]